MRATHVCVFSEVSANNIYITRIQAHFHCGHNPADAPLLQLALFALPLDFLSKAEQEYAAKAIACGYLDRDGRMLYTKLLVHDLADADRLFALSQQLTAPGSTRAAQEVAAQPAALIHTTVPAHLLDK